MLSRPVFCADSEFDGAVTWFWLWNERSYVKAQRDFCDVFGVLERHMMCIGCWRGDGKLERLSLDQFLM